MKYWTLLLIMTTTLGLVACMLYAWWIAFPILTAYYLGRGASCSPQ
jgi:hypothetical protein